MITSLFAGCVNNSTEEEQIEYNTDFSFNLLTSEKINVSRYAGKIVLVDFTGVNCPYCVPQMFVLENIYNNYRNDDIVILSIYVWMVLGETIQDINNLIEAYRCSSPCDAENNFTNVQLRDAKEYYEKQDGLELNWIFGYDNLVGTLYDEYGKKGIPYLLILDKNGNIYYSKAGYTDYNSLTIKLDELIG